LSLLSLSICIPIYQSDVRQLVYKLLEQIERIADAQIHIVLIDDASDENFRALNHIKHPAVQFIALPQNIGRAKIRNAFLNYTQADYLLFIDGDSAIEHSDFVAKYWAFLQKFEPEVLVGASVYQNKKPSPNYLLRWRYSTQRESLSFEQRSKNPALGFKTNNFIIKRDLLLQQPFEEQLTTYGHEDTLFGIQLLQAKIRVQHIDNPVWNLHLDDNQTFLFKTDQALQNLLWLQAQHPSQELLEVNKLLAKYLEWSSKTTTSWLLNLLAVFTRPMKGWLLSGKAPLLIFDLYRLSRLHLLDKHSR
jgi:glycosyltransferase involved in cell wall biosynthesis